MIRFITLLCVLTLLALDAAGQDNVPNAQARPIKQYPIEEFLRTTNYRGASFSPDNSRVLVTSDKSGVYNAFSIPVDGGEPKQLTSSTKESIFAHGYFPNDERFLYSSDEGGNELDHLFVRELDGSDRDLTPGEKLKAEFHGWAQDNRSFFVGTNERDHRYMDVYQYQVDDYDRQLIYRNDDGRDFVAISPDNKTIALWKTHTRDDSDIYFYDVGAKEMAHVTAHEGDINHQPQMFSPDGKGFYFLTDKESEFLHLVRQDMVGGDRTVIDKPEWDVWYAYFSKHGKYLIVATNMDARTELRVIDTSTMKRVDVASIEGADTTSLTISDDETCLAMYASSGRMPRDLFYHDFSTNAPKQLTRSLSANIDSTDLVDGQLVRFRSFDDLEIPGILYKPHQINSENKAPAVVWVHGGPGGQSRIGYVALVQYLVNHGYVVYMINNRGSSGYGKTFQQLDDRKHGEGDLDDCVTSKQMLIDTGFVDPERIGIMGGSYGGYMVLAALTFRPEEFTIGVDIFGISNWLRTLQNIPPWWESYRSVLVKEMGDFDDEKYLRSISPIFYAKNIRRPLMVLQGANDPRVLKVESDEIVEAVKQNDGVLPASVRI